MPTNFVEEFRSELAKLVSVYASAKTSISKSKSTNPLIDKPTIENVEKKLQELVRSSFSDFKTKLTQQLNELEKSQQLSSIMLVGNPINDTITDLRNHITETINYIDGINLEEFCKDFDTKTDGKLKIDDLMTEITGKVDPNTIVETIQNTNTQILDAVRTTFVKKRDNLNAKVEDVRTKLEELKPLEFIPEIKAFISDNEPLLASAKSCPHEKIDIQMMKLDGIDFSKFDKAKDKFKAEKQMFEDKKFGDLKTKLEALKTATPTLAPLIDPLLDSFKSIESPATMALETFEKDETKLFAPIEATITAFITQQANSMTDLSPFHYAIEPSKLGGLNQLITELNSITELTPEKLEKAFAIQQVAAEIRTDLKAKKLLADDDKSHRLDSPNDRLVGELGAISKDIMDIRTTARNISDQSSEQILQNRLKMLGKRCANLQGKDGHIDAHQRAIALQRSLLIKEKNAEILNKQTPAATDLAEDIKTTLTRYKTVRDDTSFEREKDKSDQLKAYERQLFKEKKREQRAERLKERKKIVDKYLAASLTPEEALASVKSIHVNTAKFLWFNVKWAWRIEQAQNDRTKKQQTQFQTDLKNVLNQLKAIDTQLLGKQKANAIYNPIFANIPHLIGGTQIMIPQHLIDLQAQLEEADRTFKH